MTIDHFVFVTNKMDLIDYNQDTYRDIEDNINELINQLDILLSRFLSGTDSYLFDGYTNIDLNNDLIAFNIQELLYSKNEKTLGD